jgi:hypothetical protein
MLSGLPRARVTVSSGRCRCTLLFCSLSIKLHLLAIAVQPVLLTFQCIPLTDLPLLLSIQSFLLLWSKVLLVVHLLTLEILLYLPVGLSCSLYNISSSLYSLSYSLYILRHLSFAPLSFAFPFTSNFRFIFVSPSFILF